MSAKVIFTNKNDTVTKTPLYRVAATFRVLLVLFILPSMLYSFMSLFPIDDGPYVKNQLLGVELHWLFGVTLFINVGFTLFLNSIFITKKHYKLATFASLLPLVHIFFIAYAWSLMGI